MTEVVIPGFNLEAYRSILLAALTAGYDFASFDQIGKTEQERVCLLRHDIDSELFRCGPVLDVEKTLGVKATYFLMTRSTAYNLFCVEGLAMVERILRDGHRIGLHFMGELCAGDEDQAVIDRILTEKIWLEREFGVPVTAISFHQPTERILQGQIEIPGMINTYNRHQLDGFFYVSDTNMSWRHEPPMEIFQHCIYPKLQFLIHPMWWTEYDRSIHEKWRTVLHENQRTVVDHWCARERTLRKSNFRVD